MGSKEKEDKIMFCTHCGCNLESEYLFCPKCGYSVRENINQYKQYNDEIALQNKCCYKAKWFKVLISIAIPPLGIILILRNNMHYKTSIKVIFLILGLFYTLIWLATIFLFLSALTGNIKTLDEASQNTAKESQENVPTKKRENDFNSKATKDNQFKKQIDNTDNEEKKREEDILVSDEDSFKSSCLEIDYDSIDEELIGRPVTKEILFTSSDASEYRCASTESYVEEYSGYQHVYKIYDIFDCRRDKSFPIHSNDVVRIYGIVTDIRINYANGLNYPIIDMYYADYIREWGETKENSKSMDQLIQERRR